MEINVIEDNENKFVFELKGAGHTFCNALKDELTQDENVDVATYNINHPLVAEPKIYLHMKKGSARKALTEATERLQKKNEEFQNAF